MLSGRSKRYWRRVFEGEDGDMVKNILTDGQWKPSAPYGNEYKPDTLANKITVIVLAIIMVGAVGFGIWKLFVWVWQGANP